MKEIEKLEKIKEKFLAVMEMAKNLSEAIFNLQIENVKNQPLPNCDSECKCKRLINLEKGTCIKLFECDKCINDLKIKSHNILYKNEWNVFEEYLGEESIKKTEYDYHNSILTINDNSKFILSFNKFELLCEILKLKTLTKKDFIRYFQD